MVEKTANKYDNIRFIIIMNVLHWNHNIFEDNLMMMKGIEYVNTVLSLLLVSNFFYLFQIV